VEFEFIADLTHGEGFEGFDALFQEFALGIGDDLGDADDGGLPEVEGAYEFAGLLEFLAEIGAVFAGELRGFEHFEIAFCQEEPGHVSFAGVRLVMVADLDDFDFGRDEFRMAGRERRAGIRRQFFELCETDVEFVQRNPQGARQLGQAVAGDFFEMAVENFFEGRGQGVFAPELEFETFGEVAATDAGGVEALDQLQRFFDGFDRFVGGHGEIGDGAAQIAGVVDAADQLGGDGADLRRRVGERQFLHQLFLEGRGVGERVEKVLAPFGLVFAAAGSCGEGEVVAPLVRFGGLGVVVGLVFRFGGGRGIGDGEVVGVFRFEKRICRHCLEQFLFQFQKRQIQEFETLELTRRKLLFLS